MKVLILSILLGVLSMNTIADVVVSDKLLDALIEVESNGNDSAIGDSGRAVGCLQIHKPVIDDVNKTSSIQYTYADRYNREKSKAIARKYLTRYGRAYARKTGKIVTNEVLARIWNGGPNGHSRSSTLHYWNKVKVKL